MQLLIRFFLDIEEQVIFSRGIRSKEHFDKECELINQLFLVFFDATDRNRKISNFIAHAIKHAVALLYGETIEADRS